MTRNKLLQCVLATLSTFVCSVAAWGIGGSCPASAPADITNCYYIDYVGGSDSNTGLDEAHAWQRAPGMTGVVNNVGPGTIDDKPGTKCGGSPCDYSHTGFIFKGGVSWPVAVWPMTMRLEGTAANARVYWGIDPTWYTGGSWSRPILNFGGSGGPKCQTMVLWAPVQYVVWDNFEFTGLYWDHTCNGGPNGTITYLNTNGSNATGGSLIERNYFHGWSHEAYAPNSTADACDLLTNGTQGLDQTSIAQENVFDGSDTADYACVGIWGGPPIMRNNVLKHMPNGFVGFEPIEFSGNYCTDLRPSYDPTQHDQCFESNKDSRGLKFFNNLIEDAILGIIVNISTQSGAVSYTFNNIIWNVADNNNVLDFSYPANQNSAGTFYAFNNTIEAGRDGQNPGSLVLGCLVNSTACIYKNNHIISSANQAGNCAGNCSQDHNVFQTQAQANANGYTGGSTYPFQPTLANGATVGTGTNLTATNPGCGTSGLSSLCTDSTAGVTYNLSNHTVTIPHRSALSRPASSAWDIGAYMFSQGVLPPGQLKAYVSLNGNDANTGADPAHAFRTIDKCRQSIAGACLTSSGPIVCMIDGTAPDPSHPERPASYYQATDLSGQLQFAGNTSSFPSAPAQGDNGCSAAKPVIYQGYNFPVVNGHPIYPVISGGMRATGWTTTGATGGSGVTAWTQYSTNCNSPCLNSEVLFYNGVRRLRQQLGASVVSGTVNTSGTAVTWVSGTQFSTQWVNSVLTINGVDYQVDSETDATHLALKTSAGTQTGVNYNSFVLSNLGVMYRQGYNNDPSPLCPHGAGECSKVTTTDACSLGTSYGCSGGTHANCRHTNSSQATTCDDRLRVDSVTDAALAAITPINISATTDCTAVSNQNFDTEFFTWETFSAPMMRICAYDHTNRVVIFSGELLDADVTNSNPQYGPKDKQRIIIENFPSGANKITQAQQWFLDRTVSPPKLYYNAATGENPNNDVVVVGVESHAARIFNANYITFRNIGFSHDNWLVDNGGMTASTGKTAIPAAVEVQNSSNINFEYSEVSHTSGDGLNFIQCRDVSVDYYWCPFHLGFSAGVSNSNFLHGSIYDIGGVGMWLGTRLPKADHTTDSDLNVPRLMDISDNLFTGMSRRHAAAPAWSGAVLNNVRLAHNDVYDTYHSGGALCGANCDAGTGHGIFNYVAEYNHIRFVSQGVTSDDGALYIGNATGNNLASGSQGAGDRLEHNYVHDVNDPGARPDTSTNGYGSPCIYTDNMAGNVTIRYNVSFHCGESGMRSTGIPAFFSGTNTYGQVGIGATGPNLVQNNIFALMRLGCVQTGTGNSFWGSTGDQGAPASAKRVMMRFIYNICYSDRDHNSNAGSGQQFYMQQNCAESNTFPFTQVFDYHHDQWYWTLHTTGSTYGHAFHQAEATANPITGCATSNTGWDFASGSGWQSGTGYTNDAGQNCPANCNGGPAVSTAGEGTGDSYDTAPPFVSANYPTIDLHLTCPTAVAGFDCSKTNDTIDNAGRITNTGFNPIIPQTYSTAVWNPAHDPANNSW